MPDRDDLAARFETHRPHLRAVAYRMLGSLDEAEDVVQDAWLRASRAETASVENLAGWLTTIIARLSLDRLRTRRSRREDPIRSTSTHWRSRSLRILQGSPGSRTRWSRHSTACRRSIWRKAIPITANA